MPPSSGQNYSGGLVSCEDGVAKGWLSAGRPGPCLVIVSLDGVPAGAGASRIGGAGRQTFAVELDAARIARGGKLTAELVAGHFRAVLPGELSVAAASPDFAAAEAGGGRIGPFRKHAGLRVTGWIAVKGRGAAPELCGGIGGKRVLMSRPSVFSPEAWKAGGQLASGYEVTFPVAAGGDEVVEAALFDDAAGLTVWQGGFDSHDCLIEDIRHITETGACRFGNNSPGSHCRVC